MFLLIYKDYVCTTMRIDSRDGVVSGVVDTISFNDS